VLRVLRRYALCGPRNMLRWCTACCVWLLVPSQLVNHRIEDRAKFSERTQVRISPRTVVFIAMATAICSLQHGLRLMPGSTQSCIPSGSLNRVPASAGVRAGMSPLAGVIP